MVSSYYSTMVTMEMSSEQPIPAQVFIKADRMAKCLILYTSELRDVQPNTLGHILYLTMTCCVLQTLQGVCSSVMVREFTIFYYITVAGSPQKNSGKQSIE